MQERHVNINRTFIRLRIKQLLKEDVAENNPHIIEYILNKVMDNTVTVQQFLNASVGALTEEYIPIGTVVLVKLEKIQNWSNKSEIAKMLEDPTKYGINAELGTIECIIAEQYWYSTYHKYNVIYTMLERDAVVEQRIDIKEDDILKL
jgi:hypothetical protein